MPSSTHHRFPFARRRMMTVAAVVVAILSIAAVVRVQRVSASPQVPLASVEVTADRITLQSQHMYDGSVDGEIKLIIWKSGAYNVQAHVHNGARFKREFTIGCVVDSTISGAAFAFATSDEIGGTSPLSRGGSKYRSPVGSDTKPGIRDDWQNLITRTDDSYGYGFFPDCRLDAKQDKMGLVKEILGDGFSAGKTIVSFF